MRPFIKENRLLANDVRKYIIKPALEMTSLWSPEAEVLVHATALVETNYNYLMQVGTPKNGGIGFWQMQPETYLDHKEWLRLCSVKNKGPKEKILSCCYYESMPLDPMSMAMNIKFGALMCRIHYLRVKASIPELSDPGGMTNYYIKHYNCGGKAAFEKCIHVFEDLCAHG